MKHPGSKAACSDDCFGDESGAAFELEWLDGEAPVGTTDVVRVLVDDDRWEWACPNARYQGDLVDAVASLVRRTASPRALVLFPAGTRTVALDRPPAPDLAAIEQALGLRDLAHAAEAPDVLLGVDGAIHRVAVPVQTVVRLAPGGLVVKRLPTRSEAQTLVTLADGVSPAPVRGFETRLGWLGVLVCNDAVAFLEGATPSLLRRNLGSTNPRVVYLAIHHVSCDGDGWDGAAFRRAMDHLARKALVVPAFHAPAAQLEEAARVFPPSGVGDGDGRVATLIVRTASGRGR